MPTGSSQSSVDVIPDPSPRLDCSYNFIQIGTSDRFGQTVPKLLSIRQCVDKPYKETLIRDPISYEPKWKQVSASDFKLIQENLSEFRQSVDEFVRASRTDGY